MRILYLHQYFNTPSMRGGTRSYEMARRFVEAGHEVHMVTSRRTGGAASGWSQTIEAGVDVHWLDVPYSNRMSYADRMKAFGRFAVAAGPYAAKLPYDLVFATSTPLTIALPGVFAARRRRVPMVFEVRDLWPELPIAMGALKNPVLRAAARALERFAYRNAEQVVALSPGMRDGVVATGYDPSRVHVIPNSSDVELFRDPEAGAEPFYERYPHLRNKRIVMYAGTLGIINGVDYLVRVAAELRDRDPSVHFVIVGDGHERRVIQDLAAESGVLGDTLTLADPLPKEEMPHALAAADLLTSLFIDLPEMWHNSANKFFDALAAATPVAINYGGWQAELLEEHPAGLRLPARDPAAAAEVVVGFLDDPARMATAREEAARLADTTFNRDRLAADVLRVFDLALA